MAAIAHSDPYAIFMRKIGYSVGLEYTAKRVKSLVLRYLQDRDITATGWHELVTGRREEGHWGRDKNAEKHIGDFFHALRLIQRTPGDMLALENLDAIAITFKILNNEEQKCAAHDFLLLWSILVNDGEIFVNFLLSEFREQSIKETLSVMILNKRHKVLKYLQGKSPVQRINRVITIERQKKNKGSSGAGQSVFSLKRTEPLRPERSTVLGSEKNDEIEFSGDYLRKVSLSRRYWAKDLGLWDDRKGLTQRGQIFLNGLRNSGYIDTEMNYFTYWPMDYELVRSGFRPDLCGKETKSLWECLVNFAGAYSGLSVKPSSKNDTDDVLQLIKEMIEVFRSLHVRKSMLRRELPITISYPSAIALSCAQGKAALDLPSAILKEQKGKQRRLAFRQSRHSGGALGIRE